MQHPYTIIIPWRYGDTIESWDQMCIWVVEQFGLPGDRFSFRPSRNDMKFSFRSQQDAVFFALRWS